MSRVHNNKVFKERRVELRKRSTLAESKLWELLRNRKTGFKFKRQHSLDGYILDFFCSEKKVIIEIDGEIHDKNSSQEYDQIRDSLLNDLGYKTVRFKNKDVVETPDIVISKIIEESNKR